MKRKFLVIFLFTYLFQSFSFGSFPNVDEMTLEEKVGELLMVHFNGAVATEEARVLIQEIYAGGIIYYNWANELHSPLQVRTLSLSLQELTKANRIPIPLLIAVDQEGGVVSRIEGMTPFPGNRALGSASDPDLAELSAFITGQELQALGINMNLAPVVDINSNPKNPVIGIRSFGTTGEMVTAFGNQALAGYHRADMITSLKHFPGHGDTETDSHEGLPILRRSKEELKKLELLPFIQLSEQADSIMTAHILVPALDSENCVTLSKKSLDFLRNEINFQGIIISDSLVMEGVSKNRSADIDEIALEAFEAGCDLLLLGGKLIQGSQAGKELTVADVKKVRNTFMDRVMSGQISIERLNQSVKRVLSLKERYSLSHRHKMVNEKIESVVNTSESQAVAKKIARLALKIEKQDPIFFQLIKQKKVLFCCPKLIEKAIKNCSKTALEKKRSFLFFNELNPDEKESQDLVTAANESDVLIFFSYNAWKNPFQAKLIKSLLEMEKPMILICLRDPTDSLLFPEVQTIIKTFSPSAPSIEVVMELFDSIA